LVSILYNVSLLCREIIQTICFALFYTDPRLVTALGPYGRTSLHIAVLVEEHSIAQLLANEFPEVLKRGDHVSRVIGLYFNGQ